MKNPHSIVANLQGVGIVCDSISIATADGAITVHHNGQDVAVAANVLQAAVLAAADIVAPDAGPTIEQRLAKLETDLAAVKVDVEAVKP